MNERDVVLLPPLLPVKSGLSLASNDRVLRGGGCRLAIWVPRDLIVRDASNTNGPSKRSLQKHIFLFQEKMKDTHLVRFGGFGCVRGIRRLKKPAGELVVVPF